MPCSRLPPPSPTRASPRHATRITAGHARYLVAANPSGRLQSGPIRPNMCSMTSQGHPYARFRRALATGNLAIAEAAARDLHTVSLGDALTLCLLYRDDPEGYERAAARWIARLISERPKIHLSEIELAAAGFREALHSERGVEALRSCL